MAAISQLRTLHRSWVDDTTRYQPPTIHETDGSNITTLTLHNQTATGGWTPPIAQITIKGNDDSHNIERILGQALEAIRAENIIR